MHRSSDLAHVLLDNGLDDGANPPETARAHRLGASCKQVSRDSASVPALLNLQQSGHQDAVTASGVKEAPRIVRGDDRIAAAPVAAISGCFWNRRSGKQPCGRVASERQGEA